MHCKFGDLFFYNKHCTSHILLNPVTKRRMKSRRNLENNHQLPGVGRNHSKFELYFFTMNDLKMLFMMNWRKKIQFENTVTQVFEGAEKFSFSVQFHVVSVDFKILAIQREIFK